MSSRGFEVLFLMAAFAAAIIWVADGSGPPPVPVDNQPRSSSGRCPACMAFIGKAQPDDLFRCSKCGAQLRQEGVETVVQERRS